MWNLIIVSKSQVALVVLKMKCVTASLSSCALCGYGTTPLFPLFLPYPASLQAQRRSKECMVPYQKFQKGKECYNFKRRLFQTHVHMNFFHCGIHPYKGPDLKVAPCIQCSFHIMAPIPKLFVLTLNNVK
jgi:hypothetical protein